MGLRAIRERRPIVVADPAAAPHLGPIYERLGFQTVNFVPLLFRDEQVGLLVLYHRTPLRLVARRARAVHLVRATRWRPRSPTRGCSPRVREGAARLRAIQELSSRLNRIQDVEGIGDAIVAEADRLIRPRHDPRLRRRPGDADVRADRVPRRVQRASAGCSRTCCGSRSARASPGWVAEHNETIRLGDAAARPARHARSGPRPRRGVDAAGADVVRVARAGRDRRVQGGLRPVRRGRPADARDLRRLRGPGRRQRRGLRAGAAAAGGAAATGSRASAACSRSTSACWRPWTRAACSR